MPKYLRETPLPQYAELFLKSVSTNSPRTYTSYRNALFNFHDFMYTQIFQVAIPHNAAPQYGTPPKDKRDENRREQEYQAWFSAWNQYKKFSLSPHQLSEACVIDYFNWMDEREYSNATKRTYLAALMGYLTSLDARQLLPISIHNLRSQMRDLTKGRKLPVKHRSSSPEAMKLLDYYEDRVKHLMPNTPRRERVIVFRDRALLYTLYLTAGRAFEVSALTRKMFEERQRTKIKAPSPTGELDWVYFVDMTGKGNVEGQMYFVPQAVKVIEDYLAERDRYQHEGAEGDGLERDKYRGLFISFGRDLGGALTARSIWRVVNESAKKVFGVKGDGTPKKRVGPHMFRRLRAKHLLGEAMSLHLLQAYMRHKSIETTRRVYASETDPNQVADQLVTFGQIPVSSSSG